MSLDTARGVYVIAPTPFHDDGRADDASIDRMTDFFRAAGAAGITVLGQMGEAPKLDAAEALAIATRVIRRARSPAHLVQTKLARGVDYLGNVLAREHEALVRVGVAGDLFELLAKSPPEVVLGGIVVVLGTFEEG